MEKQVQYKEHAVQTGNVVVMGAVTFQAESEAHAKELAMCINRCESVSVAQPQNAHADEDTTA